MDPDRSLIPVAPMNHSDETHSPSAWLLDGRGGARLLDDGELGAWQPRQGTLWVTLDEASERDRLWLQTESGLDAENSREFLGRHAWPTVRVGGSDQISVIMRVFASGRTSSEWAPARLRLLIEPKRVISVSPRALPHIEAVNDRLKAGRGPTSVGDIVLLVTELMADSLTDAVLALIPSVVHELAAEVQDEPPKSQFEQVRNLRKRVVELQRYADPQRAILTRLRSLDLAWLTRDHRQQWRALAEYYLEASRELDGIAEHARVHEDSLASRISEQMNRRIYTLTLVSTLVLPLSLVTGLLGVNISTVDANILSTHHPSWFIGLSIGLVILGLGIFIAFHRWWIR